MAGRMEKTKICDKGSEEEWISKLPDDLIIEILIHLPTKDVVTTSLLSTRWRNLWQCVPGLDLDAHAFSSTDAFLSFAKRFFDSHSHRDSWIRKLRLSITHKSDCKSFLTTWIDAVTRRKIQHLDLYTADPFDISYEIPLSIYTCETLVHLRLSSIVLANVEFVSLPCLKIMHLNAIKSLPEASLEKLISGSPVLQDLTITGSHYGRDVGKVIIQVRSQTLKRIHIGQDTRVVIDAPLLQCLRAVVFATKNFKITNLGVSTKLDLVVSFSEATDSKSLIHGILADVSRVRDLVLRNVCCQNVFRHAELGQLFRGFSSLSRLNVKFFKFDLEKLPTILESCSKLESLILELVSESFVRDKKNREPKVIMFPTVPECMVSSLKFVELKRLVSGYDGEMGLIRYFLKNSTFLEKLRLDIYHTKKEKCDFLIELVAMPRRSSACEVLVL